MIRTGSVIYSERALLSIPNASHPPPLVTHTPQPDWVMPTPQQHVSRNVTSDWAYKAVYKVLSSIDPRSWFWGKLRSCEIFTRVCRMQPSMKNKTKAKTDTCSPLWAMDPVPMPDWRRGDMKKESRPELTAGESPCPLPKILLHPARR